MAATQKSIAEELGISRQLVGFALNNHPGVSVETREKVLQTAQRMGYDAFANREARALIAKRYGRRAKTGILATLLPPSEQVPLREIPSYARVLDAIEKEAERRGLDVLLCRYRNGQMPRMIQNLYVDGVACVSTADQTMKAIEALDLPVINLGRVTHGSCWICPDDAAGIELATEHVIQRGHRRIAYLGHSPSDEHGKVRFNAFKKAMKKANVGVDENILEATVTSQTLASGLAGMERLLARTAPLNQKPPFSALVCYNDLMGAGAIKAMQARGIEIPRDVSVIGFGDNAGQFDLKPGLTTVTYSREEMGARAIARLCEDEIPTGGERMPVQLLERESVTDAKL